MSVSQRYQKMSNYIDTEKPKYQQVFMPQSLTDASPLGYTRYGDLYFRTKQVHPSFYSKHHDQSRVKSYLKSGSLKYDHVTPSVMERQNTKITYGR